MEIEYYINTINTSLGVLELYVADNMCNTFIYPEFLLKRYSSIPCLDDPGIINVLDVGCGAGPFCIFWGKLGKRVVGIDINPIAIECSKRNIEKYSLQDKVIVRQEGIESFQSDILFDLIVCNPPIGDDSFMRKNISSEYNRLNDKIRRNIIDAEVEDFLTNCWKNSDGKDVIDYIFERAGSLLRQQGKIVFVCGDDFVEGDSLICDKASVYSSFKVMLKQKISEHLRIEDSGEIFECDKKYNLLLFEYGNNLNLPT